jgi:hypothetical protein
LLRLFLRLTGELLRLLLGLARDLLHRALLVRFTAKRSGWSCGHVFLQGNGDREKRVGKTPTRPERPGGSACHGFTQLVPR